MSPDYVGIENLKMEVKYLNKSDTITVSPLMNLEQNKDFLRIPLKVIQGWIKFKIRTFWGWFLGILGGVIANSIEGSRLSKEKTEWYDTHIDNQRLNLKTVNTKQEDKLFSDYDLYLEKKDSNGNWSVVKSITSVKSNDEILEYTTADAGTYRLKVKKYSDALFDNSIDDSLALTYTVQGQLRWKSSKKSFFLFLLVWYSLCQLALVLKTSDVKVEKKYNLEDVKKFHSLINKYNNENGIKSIYDEYFSVLWRDNKENNGKFKYLLNNRYEIITSENELKEKFLNKFTLEHIKKYYHIDHFVTNLSFDVNTLTEEKLEKMNREKFQETFLDNQDISEFFKNKNLLMYESWYDHASQDRTLVADYKNNNKTNLHFNIVDSDDLGFVINVPDYVGIENLKMEVKYLNKSDTITVSPLMNLEQNKDFYEYLKKLYKEE
ncbi:hypothetical protein ACR82Z_00595 [Mycoplasma sp. 6243]|uniref:hypothetical protein n=1 Tax=Mycoplasma sp. 6243 TaxID=3440865 RepID=UPI003EB9D1EB